MRQFLLSVFYIVSLSASAQTNLVINPSFEDYTNCPNSFSSIVYVTPIDYATYAYPTVVKWITGTMNGSPDYHNSCAGTGGIFSTPTNIFGYMRPRTGVAYAGIWSYPSGVNLEYLQTRLKSPMISGHQYYISYYVGLGTYSDDGSGRRAFSVYGIDNMGATFTVGQSTSSNATLPFTAGIMNPEGRYITDTAGWTKVDGTFTATGNEEWMVIGYFTRPTPPSLPFDKLVWGSTTLPPNTYYYVDDVCVLDMDSALTSSHSIKMCNADTPSITSPQIGQSYIWNTGDTGKTIKITHPGTYWVHTIGECTAFVDTMHVTIYSSLPLGNPLVDTSFCNEGTLIIGTSKAYDTYQWNTGDTTPTITISKAGKYILTVADQCGTQKDSMTLSIHGTLPPQVFDTFACKDMTAPAIRVIGNSLTWYTSPTGSPFQQQPYINTADTNTTTLYVTQTGICGESPKATVHIAVLDVQPHISLTDDNPLPTLCAGDSVVIKASSDQPVHYIWNTGDTAATYIVRETGDYTVAGMGRCGLDTSDVKSYTFRDCKICLSLPTAFTPNNDGLNDVFRAKAYCNMAAFKLVIFNRWGQVVFSSLDVNDKWDGAFNGQPQDAGTYFYDLEYTTGTSHPYKATSKGDVVLIR